MILRMILAMAVTSFSACTRDPKPEEVQSPKVVVADLQKVDVQIGNGAEATVGKRIELEVLQLTARGKVLRSTRADKKRAEAVADPAENPPGLGTFAIGMRVGGRRRVTVPHGPKFGNAHESGEPVIYELELVSVK